MARILTLTSWYPPHHFGGYELSCHDVMRRLVARGHEVRVVCGDERVAGARPTDEEHEALVHRELRPHLREATRSRPQLRELVAIEREDHRLLARHLAEFRPDVVSVWHMVAIPASLLELLTESGVPVVYVVCDRWPVATATTDPWVARFEGGVGRALAGRAVQRITGLPTTRGRFTDHGTFCFVSEATRHAVVSAQPWSYPVSTVVYSGIEPSAFATESPPLDEPDESHPRDGARLLYVGRFEAWKGLDTLLRALAALPPGVTLDCFGRGAEHERVRLHALAGSLGISDRVTFGSLEREELAAHYRAADVVVFPSEWPEPFGLVPLEAMACGTPVVASGVGGSAEFLRDGENCVRFPAGNANALARAITRVLGDADLRRGLVKTGFETARELTVDGLTDTLEKWHVAAAERFARGVPRDRATELATAGVTVIPSWPPIDDRAPVAAATLAPRPDGPVLDLTIGGTTIRVAGATVRARADALPLRDHSVVAATTTDAHAGAELARAVRQGATVVITATNPLDALHLRGRLLERLRLGPDRSVSTARGEATPIEAHFDVVARHAVAWTAGGRKRALASKIVRFGPLRRFGPAVVLEARPRELRP